MNLLPHEYQLSQKLTQRLLQALRERWKWGTAAFVLTALVSSLWQLHHPTVHERRVFLFPQELLTGGSYFPISLSVPSIPYRGTPEVGVQATFNGLRSRAFFQYLQERVGLLDSLNCRGEACWARARKILEVNFDEVRGGLWLIARWSGDPEFPEKLLQAALDFLPQLERRIGYAVNYPLAVVLDFPAPPPEPRGPRPFIQKALFLALIAAFSVLFLPELWTRRATVQFRTSQPHAWAVEETDRRKARKIAAHGLALLTAAAPLLPPTSFGAGISLDDFPFLLAIGWGLLWTASLRLRPKRPPYWVLFSLLTAVGILSAFWNYRWSREIIGPVIRSLRPFAFLILLFTQAMLFRGREDFLRLLRYMGGMVLFEALLGIFASFTGLQIPFREVVIGAKPDPNLAAVGITFYRAVGTLHEPNFMGGLMLFGIFLALGLAAYEQKPLARFLWLFTALTAFVALLFTLTRVAVLIFPLSLALFLTISRRTGLLAVAALAGILTILGFPPLRERLLSPEVRYGGRIAVIQRYVLQRVGVEIARKNFWLGVGPGNYQIYLAHHPIERYVNLSPGMDEGGLAVYNPHNSFIIYFAELGILGLLLSLSLAFAQLFRLGRAALLWRRRLPGLPLQAQGTALLTIGLFSGAFALFLQNASNDIFNIPTIMTYFWSLAFVDPCLWPSGQDPL